ncbi:MAG: lipid-A-disaccharide synthase [Pyrinomonadaceae bacterium]
MRRTIMIVAGEASGDRHAAKLVEALVAEEPDTLFSFFGSAGPKMRAAGVEPSVGADGLSVVGLAEIGRALPMFLRASRCLKNEAKQRNPDAILLVDFPDFNLKLAKALKKKGFRIIYYISPQLWAWRRYRISAVRKYVDLLLAILPFEKDWYLSKGVAHVEFVGNPLAKEVRATRTREEFCSDHGLDSERPIISLLPGSRHKEVTRILPVMLDSAEHIRLQVPDAQFVIAAASSSSRKDIDLSLAKRRSDIPLTIVGDETYDALGASDAAAVTSGTATLEAGIIGTPMAIVYKSSALNYFLLRPLIAVEHFGLINLIGGERIVKEMIQDEFTPEKLSTELLRLLQPDENRAVRAKLNAAAERLGQGGASKRAAQAIIKFLDVPA